MDNTKPAASCRVGGKKGKSSANFPPVTVEYKHENGDKIPENVKKNINNFSNSTSTESQLGVTKSILDSLVQLEDVSQEYVIKFLVLVLLESELKHPVKCLLIRQVDQLENIHDVFMKHLSQILLSYEHTLSGNKFDYPKHVKFILGLSSCFENFPLGVKTVENIALTMLDILSWCIVCFVDKLKHVLLIEKLVISKQIHQTLHLYLNVCHKARRMLEDSRIYDKQSSNITFITQQLVFRDDVSMDSKALCAVILVTREKNHYEGRDPWLSGKPMFILHPRLKYWESKESVLLCYYCALITSAPADVAPRLDFTSSHEVAEHILTLIKKVVHIIDRLSGSVSVSLCGARALATASEWLNNAGPIENKYDSNKEQSDLNPNEFNELMYESDLDIIYDLNLDESESDVYESHSNKFKSDLDTLDPWLWPNRKREYKEGEVYMGRTLELARVLVKFAERRLQHHAPALRHLAEQIQANVMMYCLTYHPEEVRGWLKVEGVLLWDKMAVLRRVAASSAGGGGGALLRAVVTPRGLLPHLHNDHKQPHVSALLDTYIEKDCSDLNSESVFDRWFPPVLESVRRPLSSVVIDVLVKLLVKAIDIQDELLSFVLPLIENPDATTSANLKCTLFLMNVISKSKASKKYQDADDKWKGLISYDVLEAAILDDDDQVVRLCMSTAWEGHGSARMVLTFLRDGAHRPRALHVDTLRALTQFIKSLEKEYRSCNEKEKYVKILVKLRSRCISNLIRGANHYRRGIALFLLKTISDMHLDGYKSEWSQMEVETVMRHLDDSYERNKQMALDILRTCPQTLLREAVLSNNMASMKSLLEGVSCRARDAEGAAYKLELLVTTLPDIVLTYPEIDTRVEIERVRYAACAAAADHSERWYRPSSYRAAALTLLRTQLERLPLTKTRRLSEVSREWYELVRAACDSALKTLDFAAPLVEAASPEGHVPHTFFGTVVEPHPDEPHLYMVGKETMTSQRMLLHAWTSAKEAWLILARASHFMEWNMIVSTWLVPLAKVLAHARHRAVQDHATKAYAVILRRLPDTSQSGRFETLGELAVKWVGTADGTRRAAGLAGLVLAVAVAYPDLKYIDVTELTKIHQTGAHHAAMALLRARELARAAHDVLPAFVRHALHDADSPDAALQWACVGVVGAGVRRIAGVHAPGAGADGGTHAPSERGRLRTSVFISRYPGLYQYILECVDRAKVREKSMCASVACSLVLLSRLLPDASTSTETTCTSTMHGGVEAACGSPSYHTRRLAAAAAAANLPPTMYIEHATLVLNTLSNKDIAKNLCHGLILRLLAMIDEAPELPWAPTFAQGLPPTLWIIDTPCFPLVHEYLYLIIALVKRYPSCFEAEYRSALGAGCGRAALGRVLPGAQLCVARALGVAAALLAPPQAAELISKGLSSKVHEVCLASLECLVSALGEPGVGSLPVAHSVWTALGESEGKPALLDRVSHIMQTHTDIECRRMSLHVLVLEGAHAHIFGEKDNSSCEGPLDMWIVKKLSWYMWQCGAPSLCPGRGAPPCPRGEALYARALSTHLHTMRAAAEIDNNESYRERSRPMQGCVEQLSKYMWRWSAPQEQQEQRDAVRDLLREHGRYLVTYDDDSLSISIYLCAASARLSEGGYPGPGRVTSPARGHPALLLALALLYFDLAEQTEDDEYQTLDSETDSELYDESLWTDRCTDMLIENYAQTNPGQTITQYILSLIQKHGTIETVCRIHLDNFKKLLNGETEISNLHSKVELFVSKLKAFDASC